MRQLGARLLLLGCFAVGNGAALGAQPGTAIERTGRQLYVAACQSCHGPDGRGAPIAHVGFSDPLPDFTDCSYASREAAQDWETIVRQGGPVRRFSRRMPSFGLALSADEIARVVHYVRSLCSDHTWPRGELNLPRSMQTEKAFPEDETVVTGSYVKENGARSLSSTIIYERRIGARNQWEVAVPFAVQQASDKRWSGIHVADVELAVKRAFIHEAERGHILSGGLELILPTGDRQRGLGDGTLVYGGYLLAAQAFPANFFLQMQAGAEFPVRHEMREKEGYARAVVGTTTFALGGRSVSPMAEIVTSRPIGVNGTGTTADWIPQVQFALTRRQHILGSVGLRLPITDRATRAREIVAYVLWDWFDGGFFTGW